MISLHAQKLCEKYVCKVDLVLFHFHADTAAAVQRVFCIAQSCDVIKMAADGQK